MADFNIRSDSVDVEQIMKQIRTRIQEKRGVDYTEEQIRELATVRLEKFLDPKNLRSDLLEQFRASRPPLPDVPLEDALQPEDLEALEDKLEPPKEPPPVEPPYAFDERTLFHSHRGPLRFIRRLLRPILKLFFNPNTLNQVLHAQAQFNLDLLKRDLRRRIEFEQGLYDVRVLQRQHRQQSRAFQRHTERQTIGFERTRAEWNLLYYEILHNLVFETTRNIMEVKNLKMRLESLTSRLDFSERRVRALEGVVQYRPEAVRRPERMESRERRPETPGGEGSVPPDAIPGDATGIAAPATGEGARRRRRRRRGRRGTGLPPGAPAPPGGSTSEGPEGPEGPEDAGLEDEGFEAGDEPSRDEETAEASEGGETPESASGPVAEPSTVSPEDLSNDDSSRGSPGDPSRDDQQ